MNKLFTIGCKIPNGLLLQLKNENGDMEEVLLAGANSSRIVGGFGITKDVDAEFFTAWLKKNPKLPAITTGAIFVINTNEAKAVAGEARSRDKVRTGLEPIDPEASGMLNGADGKTPEPAALAQYRKQKRENPDRNRQIQE